MSRGNSFVDETAMPSSADAAAAMAHGYVDLGTAQMEAPPAATYGQDNWFQVGPVDRTRLAAGGLGAFVVRESSSRQGSYTLSLWTRTGMQNIAIHCAHQKYSLAPTRAFNSLPELIAFYRQNSLQSDFSNIDHTLGKAAGTLPFTAPAHAKTPASAAFDSGAQSIEHAQV